MPSEKIQKLVELIGQLDPTDKAHFTKKNLPDSRVLAEKLGEAVSSADRDEAWEAFKFQHPITAAKMISVLVGETGAETPAEEKAAKPVDLTGATSVVTMVNGKPQPVWFRDGKKIHVGPAPETAA